MNKLTEAQPISAEDYAKLSDQEKKEGHFTTKVMTFTYQPAVTIEDLAKIKNEASRWTKFLLKFVRTHYAWDDPVWIAYKDFRGIRYVVMSKTRGWRFK